MKEIKNCVSITLTSPMHNSIEVKNMNFNKMVADNKKCVCLMMSALGAAMGCFAAKLWTSHCCCSQKLSTKAKKAFKAAEDKLMP